MPLPSISSDQGAVALPQGWNQVSPFMTRHRKLWTSHEQEIAKGLWHLGVPTSEIGRQIGRSASVVSGRLNPEQLRRKRELERVRKSNWTPEQRERNQANARKRERELQKQRQQLPIVIDSYCGVHPRLPVAIRDRILALAIEKGGPMLTAYAFALAIKQVADDHREIGFGNPLLNESRIDQLAKSMVESWRAHTEERPPKYRQPRTRQTIEKGITEVVTGRLDGTTCLSYQVRFVSIPYRFSHSFPTLALARAWKKLAQQAVDEGRDPRTVPYGVLAWKEILKAADVGSASPCSYTA